MMLRTLTMAALSVTIAGMNSVQGATLSVGNLATPPNTINTVTVSGSIAGESTYGVTILLELVPRVGNTGTLTFTVAPPTDVNQVGDPWPGAGTFSPYDTDASGSVLLNGTVDDDGIFIPALVTYTGPLSRFPIRASATANGIWDVLLSTSAGASGWEGLTTTLVAGTVTVTPSACLADAECSDGNVCTTDLCNAGTCMNPNNSVSCSDGNLCTTGDVCNGGVCVGAPLDCSGLNDSCNVGTCNAGTGTCQATPAHEGGTCSDGFLCTQNDVCGSGVCAGTPVNCSALDDPCNVGTCNVSTGLCEAIPSNKGGSCDDGDLCTQNDVCGDGTCAGTPVDCSGINNECNIGVCNGATGLCQPQPANEGGSCSDGLLCTENDSCGGGVCAGTAMNCSALNSTCTVGVCNSGTGICQSLPANEGGICNDNNTCTNGDHCVAGVCSGTPISGCDPCVSVLDCDDGNPCTTDSCHPVGVCIYTNNTSPCNDGLFCTLNDVCSASVCVGTGNTCPGQLCNEGADTCVECLVDGDCTDGNPCTDDACLGGACMFAPNAGPCSDGLFCTVTDGCAGGTCVGIGDPCSGGLLCDEATDACVDCLTNADCDDGNVCTNDVCTAGVCSNPNNTLPCNDGLFCTATDVCAGGVCVGTGDPCPSQLCSEKLDACVECLSSVDCDDSNVCTDDACSVGNCVLTPNSMPCDDGFFCTLSDVCAGGSCLGAGDPCTPPLLCDENTNACVECLGSLDCDDDNPCTDDICSSGVCSNPNNLLPCSDGLFCTATDVCSGGVCMGSGGPCVLPLLCNEVTNACVDCLTDGDCDDFNPCTDDLCSAGTCSHTHNSAPCNDGLFCTATDVCAGGSCTGGGDPCTLPLLCDESADACVNCLTAANCSDGNVCTDDLCTAGVCSNPNNVLPCDDGLFCTASDFCSGGSCVGSLDPCTPPDLCDEATNACVECLTDVECNDSNPCTTDTCVAGTCQNADNNLPCDDGLFCTLTDVCTGGACVGGGIRCPGQLCNETMDACVACLADSDCNDLNPCTDDTCVSGGCVATDNSALCDDGLFCTLTDVCSGGACIGSGAPCMAPLLCDEAANLCVSCLTLADCDDFNPCTDDVCTAGVCGYVNNSASCDDGLFCTAVDVCSGGTCVGGGDPCLPPDLCDESLNACVECLVDGDCDDANGCTDDDCFGGICQYVDNVLPCDDGLFCTASDICAGGACVGSGDPCGGQLCNEVVDACVNCLVDADCDDSNPCTDDTCVAGACVLTHNTTPCNDGNICTITDHCANGTCAGVPVDCSSLDTGCMAGVCNATTGLCEAVQVNEGGPCSDGDLCTSGDTCTSGLCQGSLVDCSALDSFCRTGSCNPVNGACEPAPMNEGLACNDNNICTSADACVGGFCIGNLLPGCDPCATAADCDDANECTSDFCHPVGVCYHGNVPGSCDDGNPCTAGDACSVGTCVGSPIPGCMVCADAADCDDDNPCTIESCVGNVCQFDPNNGVACNDSNICTATDTCSGGACAGTPIAGCDQCSVNLDCNDGNPCTTDTCHPIGICIYANNTNLCDDGVACTQNDVCNNGACAGSPTPDGGTCNDGSLCTANDTCFGGVCGGAPANEGASCTDGNLCTLTDVCVAGTCTGVAIDCAPLTDDCNVGTCNLTTGSCQPVPINEGGVCSDGDLCTMSDTCTAGTCAGSAVDCSPLTNLCAVGTCNASTGICEALPRNEGVACDDSSVCTVNDTCTGGQCVGAGTDCTSFDGVCTVGVCNPVSGSCETAPAHEGGACDDGLLCTQNDACAGGSCVGSPVDCSASSSVCQASTCNPSTGACDVSPANEGGACDDGDLCTQNDACAAGNCVGTPTDCSGLSVGCMVGACNGATGLCQQVPVGEGGACNDGNLCTQNDHCTGGVCAGTATNCSSLNSACTLGQCNGTTGQCIAIPTNQGGSCNDNLRCTINDRCNAGTCSGTATDCSALNNACNQGVCNPSSGQCLSAPANEGGTCNDGLSCTINDVCVNGTCDGTSIQPELVNLIWTPGAQTVTVGSVFQVALVADSATCFTIDVGSVQAILNWNPAFLRLVGHVDNGPYAWISSEFPNDQFLDGLNAPYSGVPANDGTANYLALASFVAGAPASPTGLVVTTFEFEALATTAGTPIVIPASAGMFTHSEVLGEGIIDNLTGTLGSTTISIVQCLNKGDCNDGNVCTTDNCVAGTCVHSNNTLPCDDGLFCTPVDICTGGACFGTGVPCAVNQFCDENVNACVQCLQNSHCNDGNGCTTDTCNAGVCVFTNNALPCDDGLFCTATDVCSGGLCLGSGQRCPGQFCNETTDACVECLNSGHCNDGNLCTNDSCTSGVCVHTNNSLACNDGLFCTVNDLCTGGTCLGSGDPCTPGGLLCNEVSNICVECLGDADCADGNVCTDDICLSGTCFNPNNNSSCEDGLFCTINDFCNGGSCTNGAGNACPGQLCNEATDACVDCFTNANCNDGIACTADQCESGACVHTPNHALCSDGLFCSGIETCVLGTGCVSPGTPCDSLALCDEATDFCRCGAPTASNAGSRHLQVVPAPGSTPVALRVDSSDSDLFCLPKYVAADGTLVNTPVFQTPAVWGIVHLAGRFLEPSKTYTIESDCRTLPTNPENLSPPVLASTSLWGDLDQTGVVDVDDIILLLMAFSDNFTYEADLFPCETDILIDIDDITIILRAFESEPYPCPDPCP